MKKKLFVLIAVSFLSVSMIAQENNAALKYGMKTRWTDQVNKENVWPEYPRPQMVRENNWQNLNGIWQYAIAGKNDGKPQKYDGDILAPFPVESSLSGVKKTVGDENYLWYRKVVNAPKIPKGGRLLLHFGAVDWETVVYINGKEAGVHRGGYDPFTFDITDLLVKGNQEIVVRVWDPTDNGTQARGKQVNDPRGIWYTPVTGIWQTVWFETTPATYIKRLKNTPDIDNQQAKIDLETSPLAAGSRVSVKISSNGQAVAETTVEGVSQSESSSVIVDIPQPRLWSPEDPHLYDMVVSILDKKGKEMDKVQSYIGMRKISLGKDGNGYTRIMLNNKPVFQFGLLDQGWWPDGLYTPPTEEAMLYDVQATLDFGFNMLRKHVKVESARFYYHCDRMGVLVWQDMPSGFAQADKDVQHVAAESTKDWERPKESADQFEMEMKSMIDHFYSFPSIVVWVPMNEGWGQYETERLAKWVKDYDPSRLVDMPSGWTDRGVGDMYDAHLYPGPGMEPVESNRASVLGEFGGLGWPVQNHLWWDKRNWGYLTFQEKDTFQGEFRALIKNLCGPLGWGLSAAVYTQTTDVEGEVNGLLTYDREVMKLDPAETRELLKPVYESWWNKRTIVEDSEEDSQPWRVSFAEPGKDWNSLQYDDFSWSKKDGPYSSKDPLLTRFTEWKENKMYLRKTFYLDEIPGDIYLKHYMPKSKIRVYINGALVLEKADAGGRKRHYTHEALSGASQLLSRGKNVLSVEVEKMADEASFDMGLYTTEPVRRGKQALIVE